MGRRRRLVTVTPAATCAATTGTGIRYTAGAGAPWTDACLVPVRLGGGDAWTVLAIPVAVTPLTPQPTLAPASLEVAPGDTYVYDLTAMTTWRGAAEATRTIYVLEGGAPKPVEVTVGITDGKLTEVSGEGLTEGAAVVIGSAPTAEAAPAARSSGGMGGGPRMF